MAGAVFAAKASVLPAPTRAVDRAARQERKAVEGIMMMEAVVGKEVKRSSFGPWRRALRHELPRSGASVHGVTVTDVSLNSDVKSVSGL